MMTSMSDAAASGLTADANFQAMRQAMVSSQLRTTGVEDARVIAAMATLPREDFVPAASRGLAYRDTAIPLGQARYLNSPLATARLLDAAEMVSGDRVLLIGAATGYTAALLHRIGGVVTAVETDAALLAQARERLSDTSVTIVDAPLAEGHAAGAPYDLLFVDGAAEELPEALTAQLRVGGRIVAGVVDHGVTRLAAGRRTEGGFGLQPFIDAECVILPGFARPVAFRF